MPIVAEPTRFWDIAGLHFSGDCSGLRSLHGSIQRMRTGVYLLQRIASSAQPPSRRSRLYSGFRSITSAPCFAFFQSSAFGQRFHKRANFIAHAAVGRKAFFFRFRVGRQARRVVKAYVNDRPSRETPGRFSWAWPQTVTT